MALSKEQLDFIECDNKNILVSASAGSGKTFSMIKKLSYLLCEKRIPITSLLVVTYTNSAGSELKTKLYNELTDVLYQTKDEELVSFLKEQLDNINNADIGTIHAICRKLIIKYFYELELSPDFKLLSDKERKYLLELSVKEVFDKHILENDADFYNLYICYDNKRNDTNLKSIIFKLFDYINTLGNYESWKNKFLETSYNNDLDLNSACKCVFEFVKSLLEDLKEEIDRLCEISNDCYTNYSNYLNIRKQFIDEFCLASNFVQGSKIYENTTFSNKPRIKKNADVDEQAFDEMVENFKENLSDVLDFIKKYFFIGKSDIVENLNKAKINLIKIFSLADEIKDVFKSIKKSKNSLDFNDLEDYMLKLLENSKIKESLQNSYKYIFVDEYQDVNEKQENIILQLVSNNNYNMIGDVKQSIYKFRNSSPKIFLDKYNNFLVDTESNKVIKFNLNFRSNKNILFFAIYIFDKLITNKTVGINYSKDARFESLSEFDKSRVSLNILNVDSSYKDKDVAEAIMIANEIKRFLTLKKETGENYTYSDIALIIRNRGAYLKTICDKLTEYNIPLSASYNSNFFESSEVGLLISILKVISNIDDDISLAVVLKNLFQLSDSELIFVRNSYDGVSFCECVQNYETQEEIKYKLDTFFEFIETSRLKLSHMTIYDFLLEVIDEFDILIKYKTYKDGEERESNIQDFVLLADNDSYKYNLDKFLEYLNFISKEQSSQSIGFGGESVKITTIHSSKGLEYPIVIFAGLGKEIQINKDKSNVIISDNYGVGLKAINSENRTMIETIVRFACEIDNRKSEIDEEIRLLYVALTRPKDYLSIIGTYDLSKVEKVSKENIYKSKTYFDMFFKCLEYNQLALFNSCKTFEIFDGEGVASVGVVSSDDIELAEEIATNKVVFAKIDDNLYDMLMNVYNNKPSTEVFTIKNTVTNIMHEEQDYELVNFQPEKLTVSDNVVSKDYLEIGTAYHSIMQSLKFSESQDEIVDVINNLVSTNVISKNILNDVKVSEIFDCVKNLKDIILNSEEVYKEKQFLMQENYNKLVKNSDNNTKVIVQGVIDLVVVKNGEGILIDYKTNRTKNIENLINQYKLQLEIYKLAFEKATNIKISKKYLYSFYLGELIEIN